MDRVIKISLAQGILLLVVLMGLGGWPSWMRWGQDGITAMCSAALVCMVALVVSLWVCGLGHSSGGTGFSVTTILSVTGIRILVTLVGALIVYMLFESKRNIRLRRERRRCEVRRNSFSVDKVAADYRIPCWRVARISL